VGCSLSSKRSTKRARTLCRQHPRCLIRHPSEVYQGSTRLSSQVTVSHRESGSFGAGNDVRLVTPSGVTASHFQSEPRRRPGLASGPLAYRALRHHMKCSMGVSGPSCTAKGAGAGSPSPRPGDGRLHHSPLFAVEQDETAARATWGRSCAPGGRLPLVQSTCPVRSLAAPPSRERDSAALHGKQTFAMSRSVRRR
jgi:hypothetical protein